ncbi:MAG TPA: ATP-binding protein [Caldithrix sp.]|nr:ATP-binding protein [Caldithrix sp.]
MVERQLESRILKLAEHFPAIAILGPRQAGKTTLAKMLYPKISKPANYLDLENPSDVARLQNPLSYFSTNKKNCIIIDEIQRQPELFPVLRSVIDEYRVPSRFIILGSANPQLLKLSNETLAGRIVYTELTPFNFIEIKSLADMQTHWLRGGFPEPFLIEDDEIREEWFNSFIMTYIERDLPNLGLKTSSPTMYRFLSMLAHSHGQLLNKSNLGKSLEMSVPMISRYIDFLENAFLVCQLKPFFVNLKKRLVKSPKVYLRDSGILHHLLKIGDYNTLLGHPVIGHSWEGYVIEQIRSVLGNRYEYFYYRTQDRTECDLVITEKFSPIACVEIKFTDSPKKTKSLTIAIQDIGTEKNYIIVPGTIEPYFIEKNLQVCGLAAFLEKWEEEEDKA